MSSYVRDEENIMNPKLLVLVAIIALVLYFVIAVNAPFRNLVLDAIYPKEESKANTQD